MMLDFLRSEGVSPQIISEIEAYRRAYSVSDEVKGRIPSPAYHYYGREIWEQAATALLAGEHLLLVGPKATGKNVLAEGLAAAFGRPGWDVSFYINIDAASLVGTDTFENGRVSLRKGPILRCAEEGGFGILDEINMAKNESLAVLHATLDFRRVIDVPGYDRIVLNIRKKCDSAEISTKALDLRGLMASVRLIHKGLDVHSALGMGIVNKCFDTFERQLVEDLIAVRLPAGLDRSALFTD